MSESSGFEYVPDAEEIESAISFMNTCTDKDLAESWSRLSKEWDVNSIMTIHRGLCDSGRIDDLVSQFSDNY